MGNPMKYIPPPPPLPQSLLTRVDDDDQSFANDQTSVPPPPAIPISQNEKSDRRIILEKAGGWVGAILGTLLLNYFGCRAYMDPKGRMRPLRQPTDTSSKKQEKDLYKIRKGELPMKSLDEPK